MCEQQQLPGTHPALQVQSSFFALTFLRILVLLMEALKGRPPVVGLRT